MVIGLMLTFLLCTTTQSIGYTVQTSNDTTFRGPELEVSTDKLFYRIGEDVTIFLTNVGDEVLSGGGPTITIYDDDNGIVYQEATYCWWELEPGEFIEWIPWDQTNQQGQQVPIGRYVAEGFLSGVNINFIDSTVFYITNFHAYQELAQESTIIP
jgi:hypothetical protein